MHVSHREDSTSTEAARVRRAGSALTEASVYFDHPQHARAEHTLNIDFLNPGQGPSARVAVELTAASARALAKAIESALAAAPPGLV